MKKLLLLAGFLVGCAPGLTSTRVEGIAIYTTASNRANELEKTVNTQAKEFAKTSGWKQIDGRNTLALVELKSALGHNNEAEVYAAVKEAKEASELLADSHLRLLYSVFQYETNTVPELDKQLKSKNLDKDSAWLSARLHLARAAKSANEAAVTNNDKLITDSGVELNKALGEIYGTYQKIMSAAESVEICSHVRCAADLTCKVKFNQPFCVDSQNIVRSQPETVDHVNKGPVTQPVK